MHELDLVTSVQYEQVAESCESRCWPRQIFSLLAFYPIKRFARDEVHSLLPLWSLLLTLSTLTQLDTTPTYEVSPKW